MIQLMTTLQALVQQHLQPGIHCLQYQEQRYWLKVAGEEKTNRIRRLAVQLARWPALQLFKVNSVLSAVERLQLEVRHTQAMYALGLPVSDMVLAGKDYMLTRDAGTMLLHLTLAPEAMHQVLLQAFTALARFHHANCYHGRPALRDILLNAEQGLTFIDLEESGIDGNAILMARDVFLLLMDTNRLAGISFTQQQAYLQQWLKYAPSAATHALAQVYQVLKRLSGLAHLILKVKVNQTAKDYLQALSIIRAM
jgi:tRNA A-37 threonylcarbamoyl transferase component Bud32